MFRKKFLILLLTFFPFFVRADDLQAWQWATVDVFNKDDWNIFLYLDNRIGDDLSKSYLQILSPKANYELHENLDIGLGYAFLDIDPLTRANNFWQHRAEFELNPKFSHGAWSFHSRNRLELAWNDGKGEPIPRIRNRLQLRYRLDDNILNSLYASNEFFFLPESGTYSENRLIPAAVGLKLSEHVTLNLFYMLRSIHRVGDWDNDHVIGTFLEIR